MTVSMLSAIKSLLCKLKHIPLVPMDMASLTPIVLNLNPTIPASSTPRFTASDSLSRCMLHVFPSYHTDDIPTWGFDISASDSPTPWRMAWDPPCDLGSVTRELYLLSFGGDVVEVGGGDGSAFTAAETRREVGRRVFLVEWVCVRGSEGVVKVAVRGVKIADCMVARGGWRKIEVGTGLGEGVWV